KSEVRCRKSDEKAKVQVTSYKAQHPETCNLKPVTYITLISLTSTFPPTDSIGQPFASSTAASYDSALITEYPPIDSLISAYGPFVITLSVLTTLPEISYWFPRSVSLFLSVLLPFAFCH